MSNVNLQLCTHLGHCDKWVVVIVENEPLHNENGAAARWRWIGFLCSGTFSAGYVSVLSRLESLFS